MAKLRSAGKIDNVRFRRQVVPESLMEKTIDTAPGLYLHQCIRTLEYIFSVFLNYNVDNNNIPVDLDSV